MAKINQDRGCVVQPFKGDAKRALFAVYDGHGEHGADVSQFCMTFVRDQLPRRPGRVTKLRGAFKGAVDAAAASRRRRGILFVRGVERACS